MANTEGDYITINKTFLNDSITVTGIFTILYMEHSKDFVFKGERHSFWEFLYVDKGEVEVMAGEQGYKLQKGDIIFHKPNEFHSVWANKQIAPNVFVITFSSSSDSMKMLENKIFSLNDRQSSQLATLNKLKDEFLLGYDSTEKRMIKKPNPLFGSEQLFKCGLEAFLIDLIRSGNIQSSESKLHAAMKTRYERSVVKQIIKYMNDHISENLAFSEICRDNMISGTHLKLIFKQATGESAMKYFKKIKIDEAKRMLREDTHNITKISEALGYSSVAHFSKSFKDLSGMTPSEYATSVKAKSDM